MKERQRKRRIVARVMWQVRTLSKSREYTERFFIPIRWMSKEEFRQQFD